MSWIATEGVGGSPLATEGLGEGSGAPGDTPVVEICTHARISKAINLTPRITGTANLRPDKPGEGCESE